MKPRIWMALGIVMLLNLNREAFSQTNLLTLLTNGPTSQRLNIVFLSEGYTTSDLSHYETDARAMLNDMLSTPPLAEYSNYFNAFAISVPSAQSGSDHYTPTTNLVNTFFNSRYDSYGVQRLITIDSVGLSRVNALLAQFMPSYDIVAVVVNDTQYGGSGGFPLIASINASSPEIAVHEMGHSFAGLGDEYSAAGGTPSEKPNTTAITNQDLIKWNVWIPSGTPIPTPDTSPYYNVVGLFQGAAYSTNYYRPKHDCKMRTLGVPFCEVCSEALVKTIYNKLNAVTAFSPATNNVIRMTNGVANTFDVTTLLPSTHSLSLQWFTNNVPVLDATSSVFTVNGFNLPGQGTNVIRLDVADRTALVRAAPTNMMSTSLTWKSSFVAVNPQLSIQANASAVTLTWPPAAAGIYLEQSTNLTAGAGWLPAMLISNQTGITVTTTNPQIFYRLYGP